VSLPLPKRSRLARRLKELAADPRRRRSGAVLRQVDRAGRELLSVARQALLIHHDVAAPVLPRQIEDGEDVVVCLHGLLSTAGVLRPLRARLDRHPHLHTATMTYPVGPGIAALASRLGALLDDLPAGARIHLVGHSLGGVVVRHFAQRVLQTISIGAPFAGLPHAARLGVEIARDMDRQSPLLRSLVLGSQRALALPHLSLVAEHDGVLPAPLSHALPGGDLTVIRRCGHNGMLLHAEVIAAVERRVLELAAPPRSACGLEANGR
jgi:pimeloyl-ACP methyl ester carboxylesterase